MAISAAKKEKITRQKRQQKLDKRSLNGKGYWMDANHEYYAAQYLATGHEIWLDRLPNYNRK